MDGPTYTDRRTVLQTTAAALVGGSAVTGTTGAQKDAHEERRGRRRRLEIVAEHDHETDEHRFDLSDGAIPAGWTTIEFDNRTDHTHFAYFARLPQDALDGAADEGVSPLDYYVEHVTKPFQWLMDDLVPDKEPDDADLSDKYTTDESIFPPWFGDVLPSGGAGLTAGGGTTRTTLALDPGEYIVECYVKTADNEFHSYHGMIDHVSVTESNGSGGPEPRSTLELSVATDGEGAGTIDFEDQVRRGTHTVAVEFEDQQLYEHLLGHDVHLLRYEGNTTTADVDGWMNWMAPDEFISDGTEPMTFLGGVQTIRTPALLSGEESETAYVHTHLEPGEYAWVAEVPAPREKGLLSEFTVPCNRGGGGH